MKDALELMLKKYDCQNINDYTNALKEIIQQITLLALWRSKFFEHAAFYGGTALRIIHNLNRFSEDLDFSLLSPNKTFELKKYNEAIVTELNSFGLEAEFNSKEKKSNIQSTIFKGKKQQLLSVIAPNKLIKQIHSQNAIKIKVEVDIDPPQNFNTEAEVLLSPFPFSVNIYQKPDLFATKIHAILNRSWKTRVKGRDWFDLCWYLSENIPVRMEHLETRLRQSLQWTEESSMTPHNLLDLIHEKIDGVDFNEAKKDVLPFIKDESMINLWSKEFFHKLLNKLLFT